MKKISLNLADTADHAEMCMIAQLVHDKLGGSVTLTQQEGVNFGQLLATSGLSIEGINNDDGSITIVTTRN